MTGTTLPPSCTPDYIRTVVRENPDTCKSGPLGFVKIILQERGLEVRSENWRPIREYVYTYMDELYGTYVVFGPRGGLRRGTYEGLVAAQKAAEAIGGTVLLVKNGYATPDELIIVRFISLFPSNDRLVERLTEVLLGLARDRRHGPGWRNYVISKARRRRALESLPAA